MKIIKSNNYNGKKFTLRKNKTYTKSQKWDVIVNHITEGLVPGIIGYMAKQEAEISAHFLVTRKGSIYQFVDLEHGAWHCIKNKPSNSIVKSRPAPVNLYSVGIEHEGKHALTKGRLTPEQYQATLELHKYIIEQYEATYKEPFLIDRTHIMGHYEVDTVNRDVSDPGKEFPWEELMTDLKIWDKKRKEPAKPVEPPKEPSPDRLNGPYEINGTKLWFRSIAGSYETRGEAEATVKALKTKGYQFAWLQAVELGSGQWYRAIAGSHDQRGPAALEVEKLIKDNFKKAWLQAVYLPIKEGK